MTVKLKVKVTKKFFYNEESAWGAFAARPLSNYGEVKVSEKFGTLSIAGNVRELQEGEEYTIIIAPAENAKFPNSYEIIEVEDVALDSVSDQQAFLYTLVTEKQAKAFSKAYPDEKVVDLILNDQVDVSRLEGIGEKTLIKIREKLTANLSLQSLIVELKKMEISLNALRRIISHFGGADVAIHKIKKNIYSLTAVSGLGFKTVDKYALSRGDDPKNIGRIHAAFIFVLESEAQAGHSWTSTSELIEKTQDLTGVGIDYLDLCIDDIDNGDLDSDFIKFNDRMALWKYYYYEREIYRHLLRLKNTYKAENPEKIKEKIAFVEEKQGFLFSSDQKNAILEAWDAGVFILNGFAGAGKSVTVNGILGVYDYTSYVCCALSGKAANILGDKGLYSMTLHRMLGAKGPNKFARDMSSPLMFRIVVLDEASMVNTQLFLRLLEAIPNGTKIVIVGDSAQLAAISAGNVLEDLLKTNVFKKVQLTQVHRQAEASGILTLANEVRKGNYIVDWNQTGNFTFGDLEDMRVFSFSSKDPIAENVLKITRHYKDNFPKFDLGEFQVIVPIRENGDNSVKALNIEIQKIFIPDDAEKQIKRNGYLYHEGDKVIATKNNYDAVWFESVDDYYYKKDMHRDTDSIDEDDMVPSQRTTAVFNGTLGQIQHLNVNEGDVLIKFDRIDGVVCINKQGMDTVELAYAISIHKSQGSSIKNVIIAIDFAAYKLLTRGLIYTAITRSSEKCILLCEGNAVYTAIMNDESDSRRTFLKDIINEGKVKELNYGLYQSIDAMFHVEEEDVSGNNDSINESVALGTSPGTNISIYTDMKEVAESEEDDDIARNLDSLFNTYIDIPDDSAIDVNALFS